MTASLQGDTGFPKDGAASPGVARQYSGTLGKVGNCQIAGSVHAATDAASAPLDWRLFLPARWDSTGVEDDQVRAAITARRVAAILALKRSHEPEEQRMKDLLILHGAWHQPAHFDVVADALRQRGVSVAVPDLGGHSLASGTAMVQEIVDAAAEPPVVLAHSFGGVTACGLERAAHLLLVAAFIFDVGESPQDWITRVGEETGKAAAPLPMTMDEAGMTHLNPDGAWAGFFADCPPEVADRAVGLLRPEPASIFTEAAPRASYREVPSTYVACSQDRAILPEMVGYFADRCSEQLTWPTSHSPYLSRPDAVVELVAAHL